MSIYSLTKKLESLIDFLKLQGDGQADNDDEQVNEIPRKRE
jgi:hypothetical protein